MKTIFIVNHESGSYDDYRCDAILATFDENVAAAKVAEMEQRKARREEVWSLLMDHMKNWDAANPRPGIGNFRDTPLPLFPGKQKTWTKDQKEIYQKAKDDNMKARVAHAKPYSDWASARFAEQESFMLGFTEQERQDRMDITEDSSWSVTDIPFAE